MNYGQLHCIQYVVGKARSKEAAESLRERTQSVLDRIGEGQTAHVTKIANGHGVYGYRVNVAASVLKNQ